MMESEVPVRDEPERRDEAWFESLFRAEYRSLYYFAVGIVDSSHVAEELVQDCFLRLWTRRHEPAAGSVRSYLFRSVRNACYDHLKRQKVRRETNSVPHHDHIPHSQSPERDYREKEIEDAIADAIDLLPARRREIFLLSRRDGLTYAEIADVLSISIKTVETQMGRALRFLREHLRYLLLLVLMLL